ncbi:MAG: biotin carboxylase N-terminal domain-containing protein [bacterium]
MNRPGAIQKVLVANRGEIACRVLRTARSMGIKTVTVHTAEDRGAPHTLGETLLVGSYLGLGEIIDAARRSGADAIHPGYGFLAENPALPRACEDAGLIFIGPPAGAMEALGDKAKARARASALGIAVTEGAGPFSDPAEIEAAARRLGPPLMLKASAGGGGKGMKRIDRNDLERLPETIASSQRESRAAFGDDRLIVERYVYPARHVEVQIMADGRNAIALGERECSLQRRHQKIIEESPCTVLDEPLRRRLFDAATRLTVDAGYAGAGTMEFLLGAEGDFYFMEMNARLQVEHPVTEACTGIDLVKLQIAIASGEPVPAAETVTRRGHAIEVRLCAEDPRRGFLPSAGRLLQVRWPSGVRVDTGVGDVVTTQYDSLLAKIIAHGADREEARRALLAALRETVVLGVHTNQAFLMDLLLSNAFVDGRTFTTTVDEWATPPAPLPKVLAIGAALTLARAGRRSKERSPWTTLGPWRLA